MASRQSGLTLVELAIGLAIAILLMSVVAPGMADFVDRSRLHGIAQEFHDSLVLTRSQALKRNRDVVMCPSPDGTRCASVADKGWSQGWLVYIDRNLDGSVDDGEILSASGVLSEDISLRIEGDFQREVLYRGDGTASGRGAAVLCIRGAEASPASIVSVTYTGRPELGDGYAPCEVTPPG